MSSVRLVNSHHSIQAFENTLAALILLSTGWVNEELLTEALLTAQSDEKRSLTEILADSEMSFRRWLTHRFQYFERISTAAVFDRCHLDVIGIR
jgi:hypothetical protein